MSEGDVNGDCEDCGTSIEICAEGDLIQPDAEVSCPNCGAVHVVQVGSDVEAPVVPSQGRARSEEAGASAREW